MIEDHIKAARERMEKAIINIQKELLQIRTGKATTALLEGIKVECYEQAMPLNQVASISTPEVRLLTVQPWDKSIIKDIEKAIMKADLGLNPANDGNVIRLAIPQLTEERRKDLVKLVKKFGEEGKIAVRNIRRDINEKLKILEKKKQIREDELYRAQENTQKSTDDAIVKINGIIKNKENEIMTV